MIKRLFAPTENVVLMGAGLLVLRVWLGLTISLNHGLGKLQGFSSMRSGFPDPLGVGHSLSMSLAILAEFFCALLLVAGVFTRFAALMLTVLMGVAFFFVHRLALSGGHSGELAFIYLAGFVAILLTGPGKFSLDQRLFGKGKGKSSPKS